MLDFFKTLKGLHPGEAMDATLRKVQLRRWRSRDWLTVQCGGETARVRTRPATSDAEAVWQCFIGKQYEVPGVRDYPSHHRDAVQRAYRGIVGAGKVPLIIDCGANMGASAVWFDMRYPGSRIVAVEPAAANMELLKLNCAGRQNIIPLQAGVGGKDGSAFLQDHGWDHWAYRTGNTESSSPVEIVSVQTLARRYSDTTTVPFILKIDIEGAEKDLFDLADDATASFPMIVMEPHDFCLPGEGTAHPFFKFHADKGRDFAFSYENIFSLDMKQLGKRAAA